ncbi:MAG: tRNA (adenosine(37)-N6)-dimethylallyltransferase MiaA [Bacilli bacterium]
MIYVICGPTGSGKTQASLQLATFLHAPIINADAFQIYRDMNIGTAKISSQNPAYSNHYLLDIISPDQSFSVKEYQQLFRQTIDSLTKKYPDIIVVGGTGLYIRASLYDYMFEEREPDDTSDLDNLSNQELWDLLKSLDEKSLLSLHPNNRKRVIRAISIARTHLQNKSENIQRQEHKIIYPNVSIYFINPPREKLYDNINKRVDEMFNLGLVKEVNDLLIKYHLSLTASQAIGYKEVIDYLSHKMSLNECQELIKQRTRNYAKRQVTFFKHQFNSQEFISGDELVKVIMEDGK